jgi:hypothetical protein
VVSRTDGVGLFSDHGVRPGDSLGLRERLQADLTAAMKRRDLPAVPTYLRDESLTF